ncbi:ATP-binding cassette domain-containing protein [Limosilactobacillus fermentum]
MKANLLLGFNKSVSKSEIDNACKKALIYDDIQQMPLGYNTHLEEEGENLSGGQKQRLVIARALLSPAKVLILDESTSSLDVITEKQIINNLLDIQNKTIIFISHNISTAKLINNIIVMSNGKIIEKGTHEDLINNHSLYYKMSNL